MSFGRFSAPRGLILTAESTLLRAGLRCLIDVFGGVKEIAGQLGISVKTAETHRAQLMKRLRIYDLAGLIRYALREKITRLCGRAAAENSAPVKVLFMELATFTFPC